jgi:DNA-binding CsgD family transcriptional regulator
VGIRRSSYLQVVSVVSERDAAALLDVVHEGASAAGREPFPPVVLQRLARLIPADALVGYQVADLSSGCVVVERVEVVGQRDTTPVAEATHRFCEQNPLRDPLRSRESRVLKLSDFYTRAQLRLLDFYVEVWRPLGIDDCLRMWLPAPPQRAHVIFLERGGRSFNNRDRTLLELLKPHLIRFRVNAEFRRRANGATGLTEREAEVLGWVGNGKTNDEIAAVLHLSSHTVRKHLENIFEKLGVHTRTAAAAQWSALAADARFSDQRELAHPGS